MADTSNVSASSGDAAAPYTVSGEALKVIHHLFSEFEESVSSGITPHQLHYIAEDLRQQRLIVVEDEKWAQFEAGLEAIEASGAMLHLDFVIQTISMIASVSESHHGSGLHRNESYQTSPDASMSSSSLLATGGGGALVEPSPMSTRRRSTTALPGMDASKRAGRNALSRRISAGVERDLLEDDEVRHEVQQDPFSDEPVREGAISNAGRPFGRNRRKTLSGDKRDVLEEEDVAGSGVDLNNYVPIAQFDEVVRERNMAQIASDGLKAKISDLQKDMDVEIKKYEHRILDMQTRLDEYRKDMKEKMKRLVEFEQQATRNVATIEELELDRVAMTKRNEDLTRQLNVMNKYVEELTAELDSTKGRLEENEALLNAATARMERFAEVSQNLQKDKESFEREFQRIEQLKAQIAQLEADRQQLRDENFDLKTEIETLRFQQQEAQEEVMSMKEAFGTQKPRSAVEDIQELSFLRKTLQKELETGMSEESSVLDQSMSLLLQDPAQRRQSRPLAAEQVLTNASMHMLEDNEELERARSQIKALERQVQSFRKQLARMRVDAEDYEQKIKRLRQDAEFEREDLHARIQLLEAEPTRRLAPTHHKEIQTESSMPMERLYEGDSNINDALLEQQRILDEFEAELGQRTEKSQIIREALRDDVDLEEVFYLAHQHRVVQRYLTPTVLMATATVLVMFGMLIALLYANRGMGIMGSAWLPGRFSGPSVWKVYDPQDAEFVDSTRPVGFLPSRVSYWLQDFIWGDDLDLIPT